MAYIAPYKRGVTRCCCQCGNHHMANRMVMSVKPCGNKVWRCKDCAAKHQPRMKKDVAKKATKKSQKQPKPPALSMIIREKSNTSRIARCVNR